MNGDDPQLGTAAILHGILERGTGTHLSFDDLLQGFDRRAYGVLLLIATLPTLIPGVAAISGPIIALAGAQLLWGRRRPWLPRFIRNRRMERSSLQKVMVRLERWLKSLEKLCRPRWQGLWHTGALRLVGLLLAVLGIALALPIPLTNYPIALPVVILAFGLTETDGLVLCVGMLLGVLTLAVVGVVYATLLTELLHWLLPG